MPAKALKTRAPEPQAQREPSHEEMHGWIAVAAYYRAEGRGFEPGGETQDWLAAEADLLARLRDAAEISR